MHVETIICDIYRIAQAGQYAFVTQNNHLNWMGYFSAHNIFQSCEISRHIQIYSLLF